MGVAFADTFVLYVRRLVTKKLKHSTILWLKSPEMTPVLNQFSPTGEKQTNKQTTYLQAVTTRLHMEPTSEAVEELSMPPLSGRKKPAILLRRR